MDKEDEKNGNGLNQRKGCPLCKAIIKDPDQFKAKQMEKKLYYICDDD